MKKYVSMAVVLAIVLVSGGMVACGSKAITYWNDLPVYPGAKQVQEGGWAIPKVEKQWANLDWSYYETKDSVSEIAAFYKDQMPVAGWTAEGGWIIKDVMAYGNYTKNDGKDGAMAWAGPVGNGKTGIALMQASE